MFDAPGGGIFQGLKFFLDDDVKTAPLSWILADTAGESRSPVVIITAEPPLVVPPVADPSV